jgi:hypothetical protein
VRQLHLGLTRAVIGPERGVACSVHIVHKGMEVPRAYQFISSIGPNEMWRRIWIQARETRLRDLDDRAGGKRGVLADASHFGPQCFRCVDAAMRASVRADEVGQPLACDVAIALATNGVGQAEPRRTKGIGQSSQSRGRDRARRALWAVCRQLTGRLLQRGEKMLTGNRRMIRIEIVISHQAEKHLI